MTETIEATAAELEQAGQGSLLEPEPAKPLTQTPAEEGELAARADARANLDKYGDPVPAPAAPNPLAMLAGALERGIDPDKLEKMFDLAERHEQKEARRAHFAALAAFQADCPQIVKNKVANVRTKSGAAYDYAYSDLDNIMSQIRPLLGRHGLSVTFDAEFEDRAIVSVCYIAHAGGHVEARRFRCPIDFDASMNDSQKMGSANSYANRYNVVNALGLTTGEDDDAAQGSRARGAAQPAGKKNVDEFVPFGKHKGQPWDQVPLDYLEWMVSNANEPAVQQKAAAVIASRQDSDDQAAQAAAGDPGELTMAECARGITQAKTQRELDEVRSLIPEKHWPGVSSYFETRQKELAAE